MAETEPYDAGVAKMDAMLDAMQVFEADGHPKDSDRPEFAKAWEVVKDQLCQWRHYYDTLADCAANEVGMSGSMIFGGDREKAKRFPGSPAFDYERYKRDQNAVVKNTAVSE
jgi:hypothetical protein